MLSKVTFLRTVIIGALLVGCATSVPQPTPYALRWATAYWPDTTLSSLKKGRQIYIRKCAGCHNLYLPDVYSPDQWQERIGVMVEVEEVTLTTEEQNLIIRYLSAASIQLQQPNASWSKGARK